MSQPDALDLYGGCGSTLRVGALRVSDRKVLCVVEVLRGGSRPSAVLEHDEVRQLRAWLTEWLEANREGAP